MNVLFLVLNETEYLDKILDALAEIGVKGATVMDSKGMSSSLIDGAQGDAFFGALKSFLEEDKPENKTIFTIIEDNKILDDAVKAIQRILEKSEKSDVGFMFSLPIANVYNIKG